MSHEPKCECERPILRERADQKGVSGDGPPSRLTA
jgi:hypothetical protein